MTTFCRSRVFSEFSFFSNGRRIPFKISSCSSLRSVEESEPRIPFCRGACMVADYSKLLKNEVQKIHKRIPTDWSKE